MDLQKHSSITENLHMNTNNKRKLENVKWLEDSEQLHLY